MQNYTTNHKKTKCKLKYCDPTVAGIDIGSRLIHVAVPNSQGGTSVQEFETTTPELLKIVELLKNSGVKTGVMESTGVYWIPLYEILESSGLEPILVDAKTVKNVPGRKTDVIDAQWIQTLYSNGLLNAAFRPPQDRTRLRSIVRIRHNIIKTRQFTLQLMEKSLQLMNIKLSSATSDIAGITGMSIIRAIVGGEKDPKKLAGLRNVGCKKPNEFFEAALTGNFQEEHLFALKIALDHYDFAAKQLEECDKKIFCELETHPNKTSEEAPLNEKAKKSKRNYRSAKKPKKNDILFDARSELWRKTAVDLTALPGIAENTALTIYAELGGSDMSAWASDKHFCSWLKTCAGNNISGGKKRGGRNQPCANRITQALRMAALSAMSSDTALGAFIRRIAARSCPAKAVKAGANKLAVWIFNMFTQGWTYYEKGAHYYEKAHEEKCLRNLTKRAKDFGFELVPIKA
jgi:transposase